VSRSLIERADVVTHEQFIERVAAAVGNGAEPEDRERLEHCRIRRLVVESVRRRLPGRGRPAAAASRASDERRGSPPGGANRSTIDVRWPITGLDCPKSSLSPKTMICFVSPQCRTIGGHRGVVEDDLRGS